LCSIPTRTDIAPQRRPDKAGFHGSWGARTAFVHNAVAVVVEIIAEANYAFIYLRNAACGHVHGGWAEVVLGCGSCGTAN